jgi:hypothetical protein
MKLHLRVYGTTVCHFESKERPGKICAALRSAPLAVLFIYVVTQESNGQQDSVKTKSRQAQTLGQKRSSALLELYSH